MKKYLYSIFIGILSVFAASCSETDENADSRYDNWQGRNESFINSVYSMAKDSIAAGNADWLIVPNSYKGDSLKTDVNNCVVVRVLKSSSTSDAQVYQSDSVSIHYKGYLMDTDYQGGNVAAPVLRNGQLSAGGLGTSFDASWSGTYNLASMQAYKAPVTGFISGFTTALLNMKAGDRWLVYIPYNMGYGAGGQGTIPGYSTLVFDLTLVKHSRKGYPLK